MAHPGRFRSAVELHGPSGDLSLADTVREVEAQGYSTMFVPDHYGRAGIAMESPTVRVDRMIEHVAVIKGVFAGLELNAWLSVAEVTDDSAGVADFLAGVFESTPADVLASPLTLIGSESEIVERLQARRERWGYSYTVIPGDKARDFAGVVARLTGS